jgi:hypothetical protein
MDKKAKAKARRQVRRGRVLRNAPNNAARIEKMHAAENARKKRETKSVGHEISRATAEVRAEIGSGKLIKRLAGKSTPMTKLQGREAARAIQNVYSLGKKVGVTPNLENRPNRTQPKRRGAKPGKTGTMITSGNPIQIAKQLESTNVPGRRNKRAVVLPGSLGKPVIPGASWRDRSGRTVAVTGSKTGKTYIRKAISGPVGYLPIAAMFAQHLFSGDKKKKRG